MHHFQLLFLLKKGLLLVRWFIEFNCFMTLKYIILLLNNKLGYKFGIENPMEYKNLRQLNENNNTTTFYDLNNDLINAKAESKIFSFCC